MYGVDFSPAGRQELWCLTGAIDSLPGRPKLLEHSGFNIKRHLVVEGRLSRLGRYGHMGVLCRELRVTRVIEVTAEASE